MTHRTGAACAAIALALGACSPSEEPHYGQSPPPGYSPLPGYAPPGDPQPGASQLPPAIGMAVTGFGVLLQQLPQIPLPLGFPPLPAPAEWAKLPWLFPWPAPPPGQVPPPSSGDWPPAWAAWEDEVLGLTNAARARGAVCGSEPFPPAPPLGLHPALRLSARGHSRDMAQRGYFDHTSLDGRGPAARAAAAGYPSGFVGENIAAGQETPFEVVKDWLESPGHCLNIMDGRYRVLGVGFFEQPGSSYGKYWTQNFGGG